MRVGEVSIVRTLWVFFNVVVFVVCVVLNLMGCKSCSLFFLHLTLMKLQMEDTMYIQVFIIPRYGPVDAIL